ncbi:acetyltransferase family protein [[Clostridium] bifermentans ATCC 19299]|uniref:GNAT family N-acetyltransferase n=1 Tax=Paraclostridium bifermentans TaxID=1490 RepID=UPI00038CF65F|nr:GNAT family N-acetyltransferase [Paraclostridium bifermentans]EQK47435.1 acetyltransferase family protein [[Clostridium] bifermentans ATCC 19299] [Paraclostridium bifermentans ATCC 19299]
MNDLILHVPSFEELKYRQLILSQEDTMSYNKGYNLVIENYNKETGCIDFSRKYWSEWYSKWISERADRYYAYIANNKTGEFVGDVCFYYDPQNDLHLIGIVIESKHRSKGYCSKGLLKLAETAFNDFNVKVLRNVIPLDRKSAISGHKSAGFREISIDDNLITLDLIKSEHLFK